MTAKCDIHSSRILSKSTGTIFVKSNLAFDTKGSVISDFIAEEYDSQDIELNSIGEYYGIVAFLDFNFLKLVAVVTGISRQALWPRVYKITKIEFVKVYATQLPIAIDEKEFVSVTKREYLDQLLGTMFCVEMDMTGNIIGPPSGEKFFWNKYALGPLQDYGLQVFQGFVDSVHFALDPLVLELTLISRVAATAPGRRFWNRGLNEENNCEEIETVLMLCSPELMVCYKMIAGTVPLKWTQYPTTLSNPKIDYVDLIDNSTCYEGFREYFDNLGQVDVLDLIPRQGTGQLLSLKYQEFMTLYSGSNYYRDINDIPDQTFSVADKEGGFTVQNSFCRINNIDIDEDVLYAEYKIALRVLPSMINRFLDLKMDDGQFHRQIEIPFTGLWIKMAHAVTKLTLGTGSNQSLYHTSLQERLLSPLRKLVLSISRYYMGMFQDFAVQNSIDTFHGIFPRGYETTGSRIKLRSRIIFLDYSQSLIAGAILMLKRYFAPRRINGPFHFILACFW